MHALLIVIVCVAPAFLPEKPRLNSSAVTVISSQVLDRVLQEAERPPAPAPAPTAPVVTPVAPVAPVAPPVAAPVPVAKPAEPVRTVEPPPPARPVEPPKAAVKTPPPIPKAPKDLPKKEIVKETVKEPAPKTTKTDTRPLAISAKGKEAPPKKDAKKSKEPEHETPERSEKSSKTAKAAPAPPTKSTIKIADIKNLVSRKSEEDAKAKQRAEAEERAQALADARAAQQAHLQHAARIKSILGGVHGGLSSPVDINIDAGGGPNAAAFLDYGQMMVRIYEQAWLVPPNLAESVSVVGVTVTVARNGRVLDCQVIKPCGNSSVDKSVRETLQKVLQFEPFPASFRESQRTFNIDFNLKAKRTTG